MLGLLHLKFLGSYQMNRMNWMMNQIWEMNLQNNKYFIGNFSRFALLRQKQFENVVPLFMPEGFLIDIWKIMILLHGIQKILYVQQASTNWNNWNNWYLVLITLINNYWIDKCSGKLYKSTKWTLERT